MRDSGASWQIPFDSIIEERKRKQKNFRVQKGKRKRNSASVFGCVRERVVLFRRVCVAVACASVWECLFECVILLLVHARARDSLQSSCLGVRSEAVPFHTARESRVRSVRVSAESLPSLIWVWLLVNDRIRAMQHRRLTLSAFLAVLHCLLDGQHLALAKSNGNGQQNYGSFSGSGLDQDGGLQPAVGG
jgi:hypothetical protein